MTPWPALAHRVFNQPLALLPAHARLVEHLLLSPAAPAHALLGLGAEATERRRYELVEGVAVIAVDGLLLDWDCDCWWGLTTYPSLRRAFHAAMADDAVRAVAMLVNSPGGLVSGCFDLVDELHALRGQKPIWAILSEGAYSAAYALASAADRVVVPRTGGAGSIGVMTMHTDVTTMLDRAGIKVTTVASGARKADYAATSPLTEEALSRLQADVDTLGALFVDTVARNRGLSAEAMRATEGGCFLGAAAVSLGLADAVQSPDGAMRELISTLA